MGDGKGGWSHLGSKYSGDQNKMQAGWSKSRAERAVPEEKRVKEKE